MMTTPDKMTVTKEQDGGKYAGAEYYRRYYATHKERIAEYQRKYYATHKEQIAQRNKEYYATHKEQIVEQQKRYAEAHKEQLREYHRERYLRKKQLKKEAESHDG